MSWSRLKMQLYGCGENSDGALGEPRACRRRDVAFHHCAYPELDLEYTPHCPLWVLEPKKVLEGKNIRPIRCDTGSIFFEVDGDLRHFGWGSLSESQHAEVIKSGTENLVQVIRLADGFAFLLRDGNLLVARKSGSHRIDGKGIKHIAARRVDEWNPNLVSGAVAVVFADDSKTVVSWDSWQHVCSFLEDPVGSPPLSYTATFASPVVTLTPEFAALTEAGELFQWGDELPDQPFSPPDDDEESEQAEFQAHILNQPVTRWPARPPRRLDYKPRRLPLPPIKELSTGGAYTTAVTHDGDLFVMGAKSGHWPDIVDANPRKGLEFRPATIPPDKAANTQGLRIQHAAAGGRHVIAFATDGSLWSAGDGLYGQLGIGVRQFGLCTPDGVVDMEANETEEEFAVKWERMESKALKGKECVAIFAMEHQTFILTGDRD
ncbi:hypothetical protein BP00DRAFT_497770 [Aspergillus indologenus CBS 114.80]|uniref:RCC1/BLIP-II n=1 Tax=Aspergillus indologenus CBS 114.80 TaxID=1450541 RepID=A0A2V5I1K5_9EURO|nr:hypothetical protein BP00DRAFT_497770 [Aspergillus indologenus CBS 114.80]